MRLSPRQEMILLGIARDLADYAGRTLRSTFGDWSAVIENRRIEDAMAGLCRTDPAAWLHKALTPSDYTMLSRDYKALEAKGLIVRHALEFTASHTSHLSLTDSGRAMVDKIRLEAAASE